MHCTPSPTDPEQLLTIDWARSPAAAAANLPINTSLVAVAGHSMGGQATLFSAAYNATSHRIKAAALHHAFTHEYPAIPSIPHLIFTGTDDTTAPPYMANNIFNAKGAFPSRGLLNKAGAKHDEPGGSDGGESWVFYVCCMHEIYVVAPACLFSRGYTAVIKGGVLPTSKMCHALSLLRILLC